MNHSQPRTIQKAALPTPNAPVDPSYDAECASPFRHHMQSQLLRM